MEPHEVRVRRGLAATAEVFDPFVLALLILRAVGSASSAIAATRDWVWDGEGLRLFCRKRTEKRSASPGYLHQLSRLVHCETRFGALHDPAAPADVYPHSVIVAGWQPACNVRVLDVPWVSIEEAHFASSVAGVERFCVILS